MKKSAAANVRIILISALFLLSAGRLIYILCGYKSAENEYVELSSDFAKNPAIATSIPECSEAPGSTVFPISVDFVGLKETCGDIVGWLYCEKTALNYPVVLAGDNDYYLDRSIYGTKAIGGTIFTDCRCAGDFSGRNTIIYGHNMKDGSMLASLCEYKKQEYYDLHPVIYLLTPAADIELEVFSGHVVPSSSEFYRVDFPDDAAYVRYLKAAIDQSDFSAYVDVSCADRIVTLSTCSYEYEGARYLLHAKLSIIEQK